MTFADYGIDVKGRTSGNVKTKCPKCSASRTNKHDPCLSVDVDDGVWKCHHCGWAGGLPKEQQRQEPVQREYKPAQPQPITPTAIKWFADRGINSDTVATFKVQTITLYSHAANRKVEHAAMPFMVDGEAVNWKYRDITTKGFSQSTGGQQVFFNLDGVTHGSPVIITEGELDAMAVYQSGGQQVLSCPNGAPSPQTKNLDKKLEFLRSGNGAEVIEKAPSVYLAMDNDEPGLYWRDVLAKEIGAEKCKLVTWPDGCKDANDTLLSHGEEVVMECIALAADYPVAGIESFAGHRESINEYFKSGGAVRGLSTGWRNLDAMWRIAKKQLNIVTGIPMSGKSEWLDALMLNTISVHGWKWAVFSPENYPLEFHFQKLAEKVIGKPMFASEYVRNSITHDELNNMLGYLNDKIKPIGFDEELPTLDRLMRMFKVCVYRYKVNGMIIDPYNEVARDSAVSETDFVSEFLSRLRNFSRLYDVAVFVVAHPTKLQKKRDSNGNATNDYPVPTPYDISGSAHWRNKADSCIAIHRNQANGGNAVEVHVQKVKNKNLGACGKATLFWNWKNGRFHEEQIR